jgi:hypothetical protein
MQHDVFAAGLGRCRDPSVMTASRWPAIEMTNAYTYQAGWDSRPVNQSITKHTTKHVFGGQEWFRCGLVAAEQAVWTGLVQASVEW